jgi:MFS family permease
MHQRLCGIRGEVTVERAHQRLARALATGVGLVVAGALPAFLTASLAPRIRSDFAFGDSTVGLAVGLFYAVCAVASTPCGRLVDRIGATVALRVAALSTAVSCVAVAALAQSAAALIPLLLIGGLGNAMAGPGASALLRREVVGHRHGLAFGAQQAGAPLGALLAGLALPAVAIPLGWRWAFAGTAALAVAAAAISPTAPPSRVAAAAAARARHGLGAVHALGLAAVLASAAGVGLVGFIVIFAVDSGLSEGAAGLLLAGLSLTAMISRIVLGVAGDRPGSDPLGPVAAMLAAGAACYLALTIATPVAVVAGALLAGVLGWSWPGALQLAVVQRSPDAPAWAVGVLMSGLFAGAVAGPLVVGLLAETGSFTGGWIACAAFALGAAGIVAATRR